MEEAKQEFAQKLEDAEIRAGEKAAYDKSAMICKNPDDYDADGCNAFHGVGGVRWKIGSVDEENDKFKPLENGWKDFDSEKFLHCHGEQVYSARAAGYPRYGEPDAAVKLWFSRNQTA